MAKKDKTNWVATIVATLKNLVMSIGLKKIAGWLGFSLSGLQGWIAKTLVEYAFDKIVAPAIDYAIDTGRLSYDKRKGDIVAKDIKKSKNDTELRRALNDLK